MPATPFVRWTVGQCRFEPAVALINAYLQGNPKARYIEPFVGDGAIALALDRPRALLADLCAPLVNAYQWVQETPESVSRELNAIVARGIDEASYYRVRKDHASEKGAIVRAAQFLYLNHTGCDGSMSGPRSAPYGFRTQPSFPTRGELLRVKNTLAVATVYAADFRETLATARKGDLVYADSPCDGTIGSGFSRYDQAELASVLHGLADRGVVVLATNADTPRVRDWYTWATVQRLTEHHSTGADVCRQGVVDCIWIASNPAFLSEMSCGLPTGSVEPVTVDPIETETDTEMEMEHRRG
jgi:DNA adenine methylase